MVDTLPVVWIAATLRVGRGTRSVCTINKYMMRRTTTGRAVTWTNTTTTEYKEGRSWGLKKRKEKKNDVFTVRKCACVSVYTYACIMCRRTAYDYHYYYYYDYRQTDRQMDCTLCFDVSESEKWSMAAHARRGIIFRERFVSSSSARWNLCERKVWCRDVAHKALMA